MTDKKNKKNRGKRRVGKYMRDESDNSVRNPDYKSEAGRGTKKVAVMGLLDRDARKVRAGVIPNVDRAVLQDMMLENVTKGSKIYTDKLGAYANLKTLEFVHETVNHIDEYVRGDVHTNGLSVKS